MMPPRVAPALRAVRSRFTDRFRVWLLVPVFFIACLLFLDRWPQERQGTFHSGAVAEVLDSA
jgi:hypothetical protein